MKQLHNLFVNDLCTNCVAGTLDLPPVSVIHTEHPLHILLSVHHHLVANGDMNWGSLLYFVRFTEECSLTREEWDALFVFKNKPTQTYFLIYFSYFVVSWYLRSPTYKRKTICKFVSINGETTAAVRRVCQLFN